MLAFSTCWNNSRHLEGEALVEEILEMGFSQLELSHGMTITKLPGLKKAYGEGRFTCVGVHNFFPSPTEVMIDAPDAYEVTSDRPAERQRAHKLTLETLKQARDFGASYVVLHLGSVARMPHAKWTGKLARQLEGGGQLTAAYADDKVEAVVKREKEGPRYYERALAAVESWIEPAAAAGVILAIESRSRYEDVPDEEEMRRLQGHFSDCPQVGYWHDFGHVQLKHNLGLLNHRQWLAEMEPYLVGGHLHDVQWPQRDHRVPFEGELDYGALLEFFRPELPLTWELSPTRKREDIVRALERWRELFPDTV